MNVIQPLIDLQETDNQIRELERESKDIPVRVAHEKARINEVSADLEITKSQLAAIHKRVKESAEEVEMRKQKAQQLRISQATAESTKELQQIAIQIESLERENDEAEARQLAMLDDVPTLEKRIEETQERVKVECESIEGYVKELTDRLAEVNEELTTLATERRAKANLVNPRFLLYYERLRLKRWPVVVTLNDDGVCDGCHLVQPPSVAQMVEHNRLLQENQQPVLVACTMCGRVLYRG